jgi:hypothetical protein
LQDRLPGDCQLVRRTLQSQAVDILFWRLANLTREEAMEVIRRITALPRQRLQVHLMVEVSLHIDEQRDQFLDPDV